LINTRLDRVNAVRAEDVRRVVNQYLQPANRTVVVTVPKPAASVKASAAATNRNNNLNEKEIGR
jgi:hypothetical protein